VYALCTVSALKTDCWGIAEVTVGGRLCFVKLCSLCFVFFVVAQHPNSGLGCLIVVVSKSRTDTRHWVGFLWTRDRPFAGNTQLFTRDKMPCPRRNSNPHFQQARSRRPTR